VLSLISVTRPLSSISEQLQAGFLRKRRQESRAPNLACHSRGRHDSVDLIPAGVRSIARMRSCLVSGRVEASGENAADRASEGLDRLAWLFVQPNEVDPWYLDFCLDFVMGSSKVMRRAPPAQPQAPPRGKTPCRARSEARFVVPPAASKSPYQCSIKPVSQSILSKIVGSFDASWPFNVVFRSAVRSPASRSPAGQSA